MTYGYLHKSDTWRALSVVSRFAIGPCLNLVSTLSAADNKFSGAVVQLNGIISRIECVQPTSKAVCGDNHSISFGYLVFIYG